MLNISTCPRCARAVTLPEKADTVALVRCPLCLSEYPLSEAIPPTLIIVPKSECITPPAAAAGPIAGLVTEPFFRQCPTIAPVKESASAIEAPVDAPAKESSDDFAIDFEEHLAESESASPEHDESAEISDATLNVGAYSRVAGKPSPDNAPVNSIVTERIRKPPQAKPLLKPLPRRKRKKRGPVRLLAEWILGGSFAVLIAYYGVWWIRGESAGWPRFDLPFMPPEEHVAKTPSKPIPPVSSPKVLPSSPAPIEEMQTSVPPVSPAEKIEVAENHEPQAEPNPQENPSPDVEVQKTPTSEPASPPAEPANPPSEPANPPPETAGTPPPPQIGPRSPADFSVLDLDTAIDEATNALFSKGAGKVNAESYPAFCRLAEVQTYIAQEKRLPAQRKIVQELLNNIAKDPQQIAEIGRLAGEAVKKAGEHPGGILLAGKATNVSRNDGMQGAIIKLADVGDVVTVLSVKPLNFKVGDEVLIVGGMVAKPAENIAGYAGQKSLVIWFGEMVPISAAADSK
jgi:hypothetical protein